MIQNIIKTAIGYRATIDGVEWSIPNDPANRHWHMVQDAIAAGAPFEPVPEPVSPTPEQIQAVLQAAISAHVDAVAAERQYSSGVHAASYVASTNPAWAAEAQAFVAWRDAVWTQATALLNAHEPGDPIPTPEDVIAALPAMVWPA